jgi:hypothetical protein
MRLTKTITLRVLLLAGTLLNAQEHAPTKAQCEADSKVWAGQSIEALAKSRTIKVDELLLRAMEMESCSVAYEEGADHYAMMAEEYGAAYDSRVQDFFKRHPDALKKFVVEDDAGLR